MDTSIIQHKTPQTSKPRNHLSLWNPMDDRFHRISIGNSYEIGTSQDMDIVIRLPGISRRHARITRTKESVIVEDLGSTNGTHINQVRVNSGHISPEEVLILGNVPLLLSRTSGTIQSFDIMESRSHSMHNLLKSLKKITTSPLPVLVLGESGTGKEVVAGLIHTTGRRARQPFVPVNCSALPRELVLSELFGHVKGAFSGAVADHRGVFERAHRGTLFLDEIGELEESHQSALLRVLETGEFVPVGGEDSRRTDVRLVSGTNRDLNAMISEGRFRLDLYHRIAGFTLHLPPLRRRLVDLPLFMKSFGGDITELEPWHWGVLLMYQWPGNVRELRYVVQRAKWLGWREAIDPMVPEIYTVNAMIAYATDILDDQEALEQAFRENEENVSKLARALGIPRTTLWRRLSSAGLV